MVLVTEWNEFRQIDLARMAGVMQQPILVDGRNLFEPEAARLAGFNYSGVGCSARVRSTSRPAINAAEALAANATGPGTAVSVDPVVAFLDGRTK